MQSPSLTPEAFRAKIEQFQGTKECHQHQATGGKVIRLSEGANFIKHEASAFWLFDLIASYQFALYVKHEPFQIWRLRQHDNGKWELTATDGNGFVIAKEKFTTGSFILPYIELFYHDGTVMLPDEY